MKISGIKAVTYIWRCLLHIPVGAVVSWVIMLGYTKHLPSPYCFLPSFVGILAYIGFIIYELNEDMRKKDFAYPDIGGSVWGLILYMAYWVIRG